MKKNEVFLLSPNFKLASKFLKIQNWKRNTLFLLYKIIIKTENTFFLKRKKDKSLKKKLKHEPNIVEITHLCIRHGAQTSLY